MSDSDRCDIFITEAEHEGSFLSVQFQFPRITMTLAARDLLFAKTIIAFVTETRGNPAFRDLHLGGGVYRHMPEKSVDLSSSFPGCRVLLLKNGEYDSSFILQVEPGSTCSVVLDIHDGQLDAMLDSLRRAIDDYGDG